MTTVARSLVGIVLLTVGVWTVLLGLGYVLLYPKVTSFLRYACPDRSSGATISQRDSEIQAITREREMLKTELIELQKKLKDNEQQRKANLEFREETRQISITVQKNYNFYWLRGTPERKQQYEALLQKRRDMEENLQKGEEAWEKEAKQIIQSFRSRNSKEQKLLNRLWNIKGGSAMMWDALQISHPYVSAFFCKLA